MEIELRIILLVVGIIILAIVAIDLYRRRMLQVNETIGTKLKTEPFYNDDSDSNVVEKNYQQEPLHYEPELDPYSYIDQDMNADLNSVIDTEQEPEYSNKKEVPIIPDNILTITIRSRDACGFRGANLLNAIKNAHLHFGKNDVFYRYEGDDGGGEALFSLVKATEPGYFYLESLMQEHVAGVVLILITDQVTNPLAALDKMVRTAKQMAFTLNAELLDGKRQPLTLETIEYYKQQAKRK